MRVLRGLSEGSVGFEGLLDDRVEFGDGVEFGESIA